MLVNLVGRFAMGPVVETDLSLWQRMLTMNVTSAFLLSKAVLPPYDGTRNRSHSARGGVGGQSSRSPVPPPISSRNPSLLALAYWRSN